jgi:hypothetical protein
MSGIISTMPLRLPMFFSVKVGTGGNAWLKVEGMIPLSFNVPREGCDRSSLEKATAEKKAKLLLDEHAYAFVEHLSTMHPGSKKEQWGPPKESYPCLVGQKRYHTNPFSHSYRIRKVS